MCEKVLNQSTPPSPPPTFQEAEVDGRSKCSKVNRGATRIFLPQLKRGSLNNSKIKFKKKKGGEKLKIGSTLNHIWR